MLTIAMRGYVRWKKTIRCVIYQTTDMLTFDLIIFKGLKLFLIHFVMNNFY